MVSFILVKPYEVCICNFLKSLFVVRSSSAIREDIKITSAIVHSALGVINEFCNKIIHANICMNDLAKCRKNVKSLQNLCNAANSNVDVKNCMDLCSKKFDYVKNYSEMMEVVAKHCNKISKGTQLYYA